MRRISLFLLLFCLSVSGAHARKVTVKLATVAPKGTSFYRILEQLAADWAKSSGARCSCGSFRVGWRGMRPRW
jgi:TRAP-type C4-dicarboxylate transport system substrate-binding protein